MKDLNIDIKVGKEEKYRERYFLAIIIICFSLLAIRLFWLQIMKGNKFLDASNRNRVSIHKLEAPRGKIYDRNGEILAANSAGYRLLYRNGKNIDDEKIESISKLLKTNFSETKKLIKNGEIVSLTGENVILDNIELEKAHKIIEKLNSYPFLRIEYYPKRLYNKNEVASHILGYIKKISLEEYKKLKEYGYKQDEEIGKKGVEKLYDRQLQGNDGYESLEVDARNRLVKIIADKKPEPGENVYLTIDYRLQNHITKLLKGKKAAFIASKVDTGEIITFVSSPEYDLNKFTSKILQKDWNSIVNNQNNPLQNRVISSGYPPGSIFKVVIALALLENGVSPTKEIFDPGYYEIGSYRWNDWKEEGHGKVDLEKAIIQSCNTYFYKMSDQLGYDAIYEVAQKFDLGQKTGINLPNEKKGLLPNRIWKRKVIKEPWYRGDTINVSIGQGYLLTTPIQMLKEYEVIANEGYYYEPRIVKKIGKNSSYQDIEPKKHIVDIKKENFKIVKDALRQVVTARHGTGYVLNIDELKAAGKTGSAENTQYEDTHAWFAGYHPYDDPEIAFVSFVEGEGHGGSTAGPIVKEFLLEYMRIKKEGEEVVKRD